jgi:hypothetical protein
LQQKAGHRSAKCPGFSPDELRVAFSIPSGSLFLVNHPVVTSVVFAAGYTCANQVPNFEGYRPDVVAHKDGQGIIIELKYKENSSRNPLIQLFTQGYYKNLINRKHYSDSEIKFRLAMELHFVERIGGLKVKVTVHCLRDVEIKKVLKELNIEKVDKTGTENVTEGRIAMAIHKFIC